MVSTYSGRFGIPSYIHYKNGNEYWIENTNRKIQVNGEWVPAITYSDEDRNEYVRSEKEFYEKFTKKDR